MGDTERTALDEYILRMDERHERLEKSQKTMLKYIYGILSLFATGIVFYFVAFGEVKANSTAAKEGVTRLETIMQSKADKVEMNPLKEDISTIKTSIGDIQGMLREHVRNDR